MTNLAEFLLARIAEDEARMPDPWERPHWATCNTQGDLSSLRDTCDCGLPARILAECEAKRQIVEAHSQQWGEPTIGRSVQDRYMGKGRLNGLWTALQLLALPYADHPDYREEWRR